MNCYLTNFIPHAIEPILQKDILKWLKAYHAHDFDELFDRYSVSPEMIHTRASYASGVNKFTPGADDLYRIGHEQPYLEVRAQAAQKSIQGIVDDLYKNEELFDIDRLNHISCSHYQSPSAAQIKAAQFPRKSKTIVNHLYHMGCYAALPAIRNSKAMIADGANRVDNIHTELCSFHLDRDDISAEQIIMRTLFADGAIKYSCVSEDYFQQHNLSGFKVVAMKEEIVPETENEMTWKLSKYGFAMTLSKKVPIYLAKKISLFVEELIESAQLKNIHQDELLFAIHPGGPKIVELIQKVLALSDSQIKHSLEMLYHRGNMSSATLPHIWHTMANEVSTPRYVVTVAFGPGLTITGAILEKC